MGRSSTFRCATCETLTYLGYGSYSNWVDYVDTEEEFYKKAEEQNAEYPRDYDVVDLPCNKNVLKCLKEHAGHDFSFVNEDWSIEEFMDVPFDYEDYPGQWTTLDISS